LGGLVLALFLTGIWGYKQNTEKNNLLLKQENTLQQAFYELTSDLQQLEVSLSKAMVASTQGQEREIQANVWRQSSNAQQNLAKLPLSGDPLVKTQKFLNQMGDFSYSLLKNNNVDNKEEQLNNLHNRVKLLTDKLQNMESKISQKRYPWVEMIKNDNRDFSSATKQLPTETFSNIEDQMQNFPQLIYDGPFADENLIQKPKQLEGNKITESQAILITKKFLNLEGENAKYIVTDIKKEINNLAENLGNNEIKNNLKKQINNGNQQVETYMVRIIPQDEKVGEQIYLSMTQKGGKVLWMFNTKNIGENKLDLEEAKNKALKFIKDIGLTSFKATGVMRNYNQAVVSFADVKDNIVIYPDLIKIKVSLDNGEIMGYEARNYIYCNHERTIPEAKISMEEAITSLNNNFKIIKSNVAVIPLATGREVLTYEFYGSLNDMYYLIYINAENGEEEKILRVLKNENGILTI
jgi:hypothetical protein